jgi:predicted enzyme related to lactoylglutathione lyase
MQGVSHEGPPAGSRPGRSAAGPGVGVALWLRADNAQAPHDDLAGAGVPIVAAPFDGPFGRTCTFSDPDGYAITVHD